MSVRQLIQALPWLVYPLAIFFGLRVMEPRYVALLLGLALVLRRRHDARRLLHGLSRVELGGAAGLLSWAGLAALTNSEILLRLYPVAVNAVFLLLFAGSLRYPPSMVERFARIREPDLPPAGVAYTRRVTQIWCGFFVGNAAIAAYTALYASRDTWSLYNGLIAYGLMGALFAGEWLWRRFLLVKTAA